jgi:predicted metal-dependent hydrolase
VISLFRNQRQGAPAASQIEIAGTWIPVAFRRNNRAKRIILRLDPAKKPGQPDGIVVTLPGGVDTAEGLRFALASQDWICARLLTLPEKTHFADGAEIPFMGEPHTIRHVPGARRGVWCEDGEIRVSGALSHLPRRVEDWLKKQARLHISELARRKAEIRGLQPGMLTVRDTRSRWGSCAANGNLSFSWRLVLAPKYVIDYVVAHEVAHLAEHNHSPRFWAVVEALTTHSKAGRSWLKAHGEKLHRYG